MSLACQAFFILVLMPLLKIKALPDAHTLLGAVGGAVTFQCSSELSGTLETLYIQRPGFDGRPTEFVNGYHIEKTLLPTEYTNRTYVNSTQRSMVMWNLHPSDEGLYKLWISTSEKTHTNLCTIQLNVTAHYNTPSVRVICFLRNCLVGCFYSHGYPSQEVKWSLYPNQTRLRIVNSGNYIDPVSQLFTFVSSIMVKCTSEQLLILSCAVGGSVSREHTLCFVLNALPSKTCWFTRLLFGNLVRGMPRGLHKDHCHREGMSLWETGVLPIGRPDRRTSHRLTWTHR
ncbi:hypothetical protein DPEC_G00243120 [Dallia pectoralis]|uniref:Uncharacterized protein n=1 Tax=Dallia pectoralis TaxID=75939 RepID=A0ACC2FVN6_DALPE|nr:hypothetical protein DPEC_G00243120 [Dallia pectoralis]